MSRTLYGIEGDAVTQAANAVAALLQCSFQERESDYFGVYQLARTPTLEVKVISQPDPEGELLEVEFDTFHTLIYIDSEDPIDSIEGLDSGAGVIQKLRTAGSQ